MINDQNKDKQNSIYINGRGQVLEMMKFFTEEEKKRLIKQVSARNPTLAYDMLREGVGIDILERLEDKYLKALFSYIDSIVFGIALKTCPQSLQRRVLSLADRSYAESAFSYMQKRLRNELDEAQKAQRRICDIVFDLRQRGIITIPT